MERIDTSHSIWLFDTERMRFRRMPRGADPTAPSFEGDWESNYALEIEDDGAAGGANLNFWLNITTQEAQGAAVFDRLFIEVRNTSGTLLATLATFSNQNSGTAGVYVLRGPYNLAAFAGQTVRIQFRSTEDVTLPTSFRVDDVSVK